MPGGAVAGHEMVIELDDVVVVSAESGAMGSGTVVVVGAAVVVGATVVVGASVPVGPAMSAFVAAEPGPTPFTAFTDTEYATPSLRPVSVHENVEAFVVHPVDEGVVDTW